MKILIAVGGGIVLGLWIAQQRQERETQRKIEEFKKTVLENVPEGVRDTIDKIYQAIITK